MTAERIESEGTSRVEEKGPPCRRCGQTSWRVEGRPKGRLRFWLETLVAAPDVLIFGNESGGWPTREWQLWTCLSCGRRVRR
ncbi:MAG: hypothetical protein ACE5IZ_08530 [Dehalococcoidia bacterium]